MDPQAWARLPGHPWYSQGYGKCFGGGGPAPPQKTFTYFHFPSKGECFGGVAKHSHISISQEKGECFGGRGAVPPPKTFTTSLGIPGEEEPGSLRGRSLEAWGKEPAGAWGSWNGGLLGAPEAPGGLLGEFMRLPHSSSLGTAYGTA